MKRPEIVYQRERVTLYCGDGLELLKELDGQISHHSVILTDPLYNVGFDFGTGIDDARPHEEYEAWCREWFALARELAEKVAFTPGYTVNRKMWYDISLPQREIGWFKPNAGRSCAWEPVFVWGELPVTQHPNAFCAPIDYEDDRISWHPCPKPFAWAAEMLVRLCEFPEETVIDPFCGSGTVLREAVRMGLNVIGCELKEEYCVGIARLLDEHFDEELKEGHNGISGDGWERDAERAEAHQDQI